MEIKKDLKCVPSQVASLRTFYFLEQVPHKIIVVVVVNGN